MSYVIITYFDQECLYYIYMANHSISSTFLFAFSLDTMQIIK